MKFIYIGKFVRFLSLLLLSGHVFSENLFEFEEFAIEFQAPGQVVEVRPFAEDQYLLDFMANNEVKDTSGLALDFGGAYSVLSNSCGSMCQVNVAVNLSTGLAVGVLQSNIGLCYQKDSRLIIVNPDLSFLGEFPPDWAFTMYYSVSDSGFQLLAKNKKGFEGQCESGQ